jgi:hypothetical protein
LDKGFKDLKSTIIRLPNLDLSSFKKLGSRIWKLGFKLDFIKLSNCLISEIQGFQMEICQPLIVLVQGQRKCVGKS